MRLPPIISFVGCLLLAVTVGAQTPSKPPAAAKTPASKKNPPTRGKSEAKGEAKAEPEPPSTPPLNACGCYEDSSEVCHCTKKSRCGCPGSCEPTGCEQKRQKELEKETQEEVKRQREDDKKRNAELAKKRDDEDRKDEQKGEKNLRGLRLVEPPK